jgi:putative ABC transport system ATP-binding protein
LVSAGQLTIGQFAAAEIIAGNLLLNFDTLARRMVTLFFAFVSCREMAGVFSLAQPDGIQKIALPLHEVTPDGLKVTCRNIAFHASDGTALFTDFSLDVAPGEKVTVLCRTNTAKAALAKVLAGLYAPSSGVIRYNDTNLVEVSMDSICACRGLVLDSQPTLLDGTLEDNITLGRRGITYPDIMWALRFVELDDEVNAMPSGLRTPVVGAGKGFTLSQILRVLVARAIVTKPRLLVFDGTLHSMRPSTRSIILGRLCDKEEPWSVIFTSNDVEFTHYADRRVVLE